MQRLMKFLPVLVLLLSISFTYAQEKIDPTGTWKWSFTTPNGETRTSTLKFKRTGDKITGTLTGFRGEDIPIQEAQLKEDTLTFQTVREREGNRFVTKHTGKISGDTMKGKTEFERDGDTRTFEWEAKRLSENKTASVAGDWKFTFTTAGGQTFEPMLKLKQDGNKVTGVILINEFEAPISEGEIKGDELRFLVVRERNGQTFTSNYKAKVEGDTLRGKIESNWGGNERVIDLEAKKVGGR